VKWAWDIFEGEDVGLVGVFVAVVGSVPWFLGGGGGSWYFKLRLCVLRDLFEGRGGVWFTSSSTSWVLSRSSGQL